MLELVSGSGLFRLGRATDPAWRVRLSFGSDVGGGGNRFCMLNVLDDAYKVGMANNAKLDDPAEAERNKLSAYRGFWSITLGGAEGLISTIWSATLPPARKPTSSCSTAKADRRRWPGGSH